MHWNIHLLKAFADFLRLNNNPIWQEVAAEYDRLANSGSENELIEAVNNLTGDLGNAITRYATQ